MLFFFFFLEPVGAIARFHDQIRIVSVQPICKYAVNCLNVKTKNNFQAECNSSVYDNTILNKTQILELSALSLRHFNNHGSCFISGQQKSDFQSTCWFLVWAVLSKYTLKQKCRVFDDNQRIISFFPK